MYAIHPTVHTAMREVGFEVGRKPQQLTATMVADADVVIDMGCGEAIPDVPGVRRVSWRVADPDGRALVQVRAIRDQLRRRVRALVRALPDAA